MSHSQETAFGQKNALEEKDLWRCGELIDWKRSSSIAQIINSNFDGKMALSFITLAPFSAAVAANLYLQHTLPTTIIFSGLIAVAATALLGSPIYHTLQEALDSELSEDGQKLLGQRFIENQGVASHPHARSFYEDESLTFTADLIAQLDRIDQIRQKQRKPLLNRTHLAVELKFLSAASSAESDPYGSKPYKAHASAAQRALNTFSIAVFRASQALLRLTKIKPHHASLSEQLTSMEAEELFRHCRPAHYALYERQILDGIVGKAIQSKVKKSIPIDSLSPSTPKRRSL